jgi:hypothetical protein
LLCTLFTGSLLRKNIENNFSSRLLAPVELRVKVGRIAATFPALRWLHFRCTLDADILVTA